MKKSKSVKTLLVISGIVGIGIGGALLLAPIAFEASAGINLNEKNVSLLSEFRAFGGLLSSGGLIIFMGVFMDKLTQTSLALSSLIYISVGLSRTLGIIIDGTPHNSLLYATIIEIIIGLLSLAALIKFKK